MPRLKDYSSYSKVMSAISRIQSQRYCEVILQNNSLPEQANIRDVMKNPIGTSEHRRSRTDKINTDYIQEKIKPTTFYLQRQHQ